MPKRKKTKKTNVTFTPFTTTDSVGHKGDGTIGNRESRRLLGKSSYSEVSISSENSKGYRNAFASLSLESRLSIITEAHLRGNNHA